MCLDNSTSLDRHANDLRDLYQITKKKIEKKIKKEKIKKRETNNGKRSCTATL